MTSSRLAAAILVILMAATLSSPTASAQGFGIKGGPTFTGFSSDVLNFNNRVGTELGLFIGGNRSGIVGVQGEVNWLRKKTETDFTQIRIDYAQLAGLLRLNIGTQSTSEFAIYGVVGPGFDFKVADSVEGVNLDETFNDFDLGLLFGGGVEFARIIIEGRYELGLRQIVANSSGITTNDIKSRSFSILFGFRFK